MAAFEIKMPKLGESITEGTIISWAVKVGDIIKEDSILFEVNTAKVSAEIPAPLAGKIIRILFKEGDTVPVGTVVAILDTDTESESGNTTDTDAGIAQSPPTDVPQTSSTPVETPSSVDSQPTPATVAASVVASVAEPHTTTVPESLSTDAPISGKEEEERWYSPLVLQLAQESHISHEELQQLKGTGYQGRLSKKDINDYIEQKKKGNIAPIIAPASPSPATNLPSDDNEIREMDYVRRIIADHMVMSKTVSAHVTNVLEADVTKLVRWREKNKETFLNQQGIHLTYMPVITEAVAKALAEFPAVNSSVEGYNIILKKRIHIGIAVSLDNGNLIVPVIHDANRLNLNGLAQSINSQALKARSNKLQPNDIEGGTFTITNFGSFKSLFGTPIINQPQVAILGVGYIEKKPAVVETPEGDVIAIRHKMYLSLSFDHRVIDGSLGGKFLRCIADYLENWNE